MYGYLLLFHVLGATVWTGGHLVLAFGVLPEALRTRSPAPLMAFESRFEKVGMPALAVQIVTGLALAHYRLGGLGTWTDWSNPAARLVALKLGLLGLTAALAIDARFRVIPRMSAERLTGLALHIVPVTIFSVAFVMVGLAFRGVAWW